MQCEEAQELITAWVDSELSAGDGVAVEAHLRHCAACRLEFERESVLKRRVRLAGLQISAPAELRRLIEEKSLAATAVEKVWRGWSLRGRFALPNWRRGEEKNATPALLKKTLSEWSFSSWLPMPTWRRIEENNAALAFVRKAWSGWSFRAWLALPTWRRALISAMLISIVALVIYTREHDESEAGVATKAFEVHAAILSGKTMLLPAVNLAAMRKEMAHAVGDRFKPVVLDLSLMKFYPAAGFVQNIGGRDLLVTVYQGDGPAITCFTFLGSETDAPQGAERFYDADMRINYYSFTSGDLNGVLHQEGEVICLLVSKMAPANLLALLRGKSAHA